MISREKKINELNFKKKRIKDKCHLFDLFPTEPGNTKKGYIFTKREREKKSEEKALKLRKKVLKSFPNL